MNFCGGCNFRKVVSVANDWNKVWQERGEKPLLFDLWLQRVLPLLPPGKVLDIACGRGRNALPMAELGYAVTALDASSQGLSQLADEARRRGLAMTTLQQDLEQTPQLPKAAFDVVLQFFYLQRSLFDAVRDAVRPGGVAVVRTFSRAGNFAGGPGNPDYVLKVGELLTLFHGWEILLHEEGLDEAERGGGLAGIVARKPRLETEKEILCA
jgi:2-polyprenyl-3-methyl-5-hydroxy-6-metoxy-1,4-benzoquinol methylase